MRQAAPADPVGITGWAIRGALVALALAATAYTFSTVSGVRTSPGFVPVLDAWVQGVAFVLAALVASLRPIVSRVDRLVWSLVAVALALRASAYLVYFSDIRTQVPQPYPSMADAGWIASSMVLLAMLAVLVGRRRAGSACCSSSTPPPPRSPSAAWPWCCSGRPWSTAWIQERTPPWSR